MVSSDAVSGTGKLVVDQFPFVCDPACVPAARGWLASSLGKALSERPRAGPVIGDAVLIASELVTNAVNAECARGVLSWQLGEDEVMVSVVDDGAGWPTVRHPRGHRGARARVANRARAGRRDGDSGSRAREAGLGYPDAIDTGTKPDTPGASRRGSRPSTLRCYAMDARGYDGR